MNNIENIEIKRYKGLDFEITTDIVIMEKLMNIYVNGKRFAALMYTPGDEEDLIVGFLFSQGVIKNRAHILSMEFRSSDIVMVIINSEAIDYYSEIMILTSGCGGGSMAQSLLKQENIKYVSSNYSISHEHITNAMKYFNSISTLFKDTGGVHGCALFSEDKLIIKKEDIGRNNAADKVIGEGIRKGIDFENKVLYTTGRVSSDIILKAIQACIPILVSHSAPSNTAIKLAKTANITLIGFVRGERLNIYSGFERVF